MEYNSEFLGKKQHVFNALGSFCYTVFRGVCFVENEHDGVDFSSAEAVFLVRLYLFAIAGSARIGPVPCGVVIMNHDTRWSHLRLACIGLAFGGECLVVFQSRNRIRFGNASSCSSFFRKIAFLRITGFLFFEGREVMDIAFNHEFYFLKIHWNLRRANVAVDTIFHAALDTAVASSTGA